MTPATRYTKSDGVNIAYQAVGEGPADIVYVPGWVSHVELGWEVPELAHGFERLSSFARLILFDKRGTGMSDPVPERELPTLEQRMDDVRAVMDAVGSERATFFGASEGGGMSILFAATHPERTAALCTFGCFAKRVWTPTTRGRPRRRSGSGRTTPSSVTGRRGWTSPTSPRVSTRRVARRSRPTSAAARAPAQPSHSCG